jgi:uncharacterized protein YjiS (DUF1127 family)
VVEWTWTRLRDHASALVTAVRRERARTAGIRALQALDDRLLRDIGVERGGIPAFVDRLLDERETSATRRSTRPGSARPVGALRVVTSIKPIADGCGR